MARHMAKLQAPWVCQSVDSHGRSKRQALPAPTPKPQYRRKPQCSGCIRLQHQNPYNKSANTRVQIRDLRCQLNKVLYWVSQLLVWAQKGLHWCWAAKWARITCSGGQYKDLLLYKCIHLKTREEKNCGRERSRRHAVPEQMELSKNRCSLQSTPGFARKG